MHSLALCLSQTNQSMPATSESLRRPRIVGDSRASSLAGDVTTAAAAADDGFKATMGWSRLKVFYVGLCFLASLWIVCFALSSISIAVLLRVTY